MVAVPPCFSAPAPLRADAAQSHQFVFGREVLLAEVARNSLCALRFIHSKRTSLGQHPRVCPRLFLFHRLVGCMPLSVAHKIRKTSRPSRECTNMAEQPTPPACPRCSQPMRLIRVTPKIGPLPELFTFKCLSCGHIDTMEQSCAPK